MTFNKILLAYAIGFVVAPFISGKLVKVPPEQAEQRVWVDLIIACMWPAFAGFVILLTIVSLPTILKNLSNRLSAKLEAKREVKKVLSDLGVKE